MSSDGMALLFDAYYIYSCFFFGYNAMIISPAMARRMAIRTVPLFILKKPVAGKIPIQMFWNDVDVSVLIVPVLFVS